MEQVHFDRLLKLADHLERGELIHEHFDFAIYNSSNSDKCGSAGCAIGECPGVWPERFAFVRDIRPGYFPNDGLSHGLVVDTLASLEEDYYDEGAMYPGRAFFGLTHRAYNHLFIPADQSVGRFGGEDLNTDATKEQVAANIRIFVQREKDDLNIY